MIGCYIRVAASRLPGSQILNIAQHPTGRNDLHVALPFHGPVHARRCKNADARHTPGTDYVTYDN